MKQHLSLHDLIQFLDNQNIFLSSKQIKQLQHYLSELKRNADKISLISSNDKQYIVERHFLPSFYYMFYLIENSKLQDVSILDFGSGAGFPGVILAIALPDIKIVLLDSSRKKTLFLKNIVNKLKLNNVKVVCERMEDYNKSMFTTFDIIVVRAVASIPLILENCLPYINKGAEIFTLKGENYKNELKEEINFKITELVPNPTWIWLSEYLINKRMIKMNK